MKILGKVAYAAVGAVTMFILMLTSQAIASTDTTTAFITYKDIKVYVDGLEVALKDSDGNATEPFLAFGKVYAPVDSIVQALGKTAVYDGAIHITDSSNAPSVPNKPSSSVKLSDLDYLLSGGRKPVYYVEIKDTLRTTRKDAFVASPFSLLSPFVGDIEVSLDGKYKGIQGTIFIKENTVSGKNRFFIYGDGKILYESDVLSSNSTPVAFSADLTGIKEVTLRFGGAKEPTSALTMGISDVTLTK
ncbi:hypothetical protein FACS1894188_00630 [Clostridia bacterium]|nr:hypothetical protein FACS1894188_00630 [Clostridia bacterium]